MGLKEDAMSLDEIAPGVFGYAMEHAGSTYYPIVMTKDKNKGKGCVTRFLNSLSTNKTIKFPNVILQTLKDSLLKRGFKIEHELDEEFGEMVEVLVRAAT